MYRRGTNFFFFVCVCSDLGVYIASMVEGQFAAKSGSVQVMDRILACNGVDFTKSMSSVQVEEIFSKMVHEPLLRMAVSRGGFKSTLQKSTEVDSSRNEEVGGASVDVGGSGSGDGASIVMDRSVGIGAVENRKAGPEAEVGVVKEAETGAVKEDGENASRPSIRTVGEYIWCICLCVCLGVCLCVLSPCLFESG